MLYTFLFNCYSNCSAFAVAYVWTSLHINAKDSINYSFYKVLDIGKFSSELNIDVATEIKASAGQEENQSKVQQSTKEGNFLCLILNASPTGLIHSTICKLFLTLSTKVYYFLFILIKIINICFFLFFFKKFLLYI